MRILSLQMPTVEPLGPKIRKYSLEYPPNSLFIPSNSQILKIGFSSYDELSLWAISDDSKLKREIKIFLTEDQVPNSWYYLNTITIFGVEEYHIFSNYEDTIFNERSPR